MGPDRNNPDKNNAFDYEIIDDFEFQENEQSVEPEKENAQPFDPSNVDLYEDKYSNLEYDAAKVTQDGEEYKNNHPDADELTITEEMRKLVVREAIVHTRAQVWKNEHKNISDADLEEKKQEFRTTIAGGEDKVYNFYSKYAEPNSLGLLENFQKENANAPQYRKFHTSSNIACDALTETFLENGKNVERCQNVRNEFNKMLFAPKADSSNVVFNYSNEETKNKVEQWQKDIEAVEIPVPENLNDDLISYAVLGEYFKPNYCEEVTTLAKELGGTTLLDSLNAEGTSKMLLLTNLMGYDKRVNAHTPRTVIPKCREAVKSYVESGDMDSIKENLKKTANELYKTSLTHQADSDEFSYAVNNLSNLMTACERSNISMDEIGMDQAKLEKFSSMKLIHGVIVNKEKAKMELNKAYIGFVASKGQDETCDPIKNPDLKAKLLDYMAYERILDSIFDETNIELKTVRACYINDQEKASQRELTPTEQLLHDKPYGTYMAFRKQVEQSDKFKKIQSYDYADKLDILRSGSKIDSIYPRSLKFGDWKTYELKVADDDLARKAKVLEGFIPHAKIDVENHRQQLEKNPKDKIASDAVKAYEHLLKVSDAFNEMLEFRKSEKEKGADFGNHEHAKLMASKYKEIDNHLNAYYQANMHLHLANAQAKTFMGEFGTFSHLSDYFEQEEQVEDIRNNIKKEAYSVKSANSLYSVSADYVDTLKWGVSKDQHVAHFFDGPSDKMIEINPNEAPENNIYGMDQKSIYNTQSDKLTRESFKSLIKLSATEYEKPNIDKDYKNLLRAVKTYVTAERRSTQQEALGDLNKKIASYEKKHAGSVPQAISQFKDTLSTLTNGTLEPSAAGLTGDVTEPHDAGLGYLGMWRKTDEALFPHEPSPNDIKQGIINDCFMMSALTKMAKDNPQKIKDSIRDNGDGTVCVRFYNKKSVGVYPNVTYEKVPVDIRVNKTVKKAINGANIYSSSSLWVQMVEKAYAKYVDTKPVGLYKGNEHGFQRLNRGFSSDFLDAFDKDSWYNNAKESFGYNSSSSLEKSRYDLKAPKREGYTENEKELFDFLGRTNKGEIMTVGGTTEDKARQKFMKDHGVRPNHAYAVMGTFEKDGKKFIQLRDPYATYEAKYNKKGELTDNSAFFGNSFNAGSNTMGTFNLELIDFMKMYNSIPGMTAEANREFLNLTNNVWYERNKQDEKLAKEAEEAKKQQKPEKEADKPKQSPLDKAKNELKSLGQDAKNLIGKARSDESLKPEQKEAMLKTGLAQLMTVETLKDILGRSGMYMDGEQLKSLVSKDSFEASLVDTLNSKSFNKLYGETNERHYDSLSKDSKVAEDMLKSTYGAFNKYTQEIAREEIEAKRQKAPEDNKKEFNGFELI